MIVPSAAFPEKYESSSHFANVGASFPANIPPMLADAPVICKLKIHTKCG
jgi:hypothetical protein